jgi:hypothetical protein
VSTPTSPASTSDHRALTPAIDEERENGPLTDDELAAGRALASKLLAAADHSTDVGLTTSPTRAA